jgi:hypothetical protein
VMRGAPTPGVRHGRCTSPPVRMLVAALRQPVGTISFP